VVEYFLNAFPELEHAIAQAWDEIDSLAFLTQAGVLPGA
jgi:hypothetical protein